MKNITKKITRISTVLTASILSAALPLTALAAQNSPDDNTYQPKDVQTVDYKKSLTPEFAYSAEKWATLRDNIMEYGELADLIHEYNPTVLSNRSTYKDQKNKNLNDIYDDYMKDIDDIWDQADNADNDVTWASLRYSAGLLTKQADNNYEDAEMEKIQYDQQEAKLVYQAQEMMVSLKQSAYNLENLFSGKYVLAGYPRNQTFFEEERQNEVKKLLGAEEKRLYCYMPTWRGTSVSQTKEERQLQADVLKEYLQKLDTAMKDSELMMIRLHPFVGPLISCEEFKHIRYMPQEMDPYEILAAADCLVTDYSSVFYDYANKKQGKIVLFLYDREKYECERDIYGEISDLPFPVTETTEGLLEELRSPKKYEDGEFLREYCFYDGKDAAKNICRLVFEKESRKEFP